MGSVVKAETIDAGIELFMPWKQEQLAAAMEDGWRQTVHLSEVGAGPDATFDLNAPTSEPGG